MNRFLRVALLTLVALCGGPALGDPPLTIIPLQHRSAESAAPALRPLLSPGGRISAIDGKLLIRTDAANLRQLREALAAIDQPAQRLRVQVRLAHETVGTARELGVGGTVRSGDVTLRLPATDDHRSTQVRIGDARIVFGDRTLRSTQHGTQFVDTVDGGQARVFVGQSVALPFTQVWVRPDGVRVIRGSEYRDVGTGLLAEPTRIGARVRVVLRPESSQLRGDGQIDTVRLENTVEGGMGEWIAVGGSDTGAEVERGVIGGRSQTSDRGSAQFWLRVDALDDD
ncbi:MAG: hypothetical protein KDE68_04160 [Rhodocyclaceae bacterium]|nr:hypothetical protein [Rhodocyclaceae bacterium]